MMTDKEFNESLGAITGIWNQGNLDEALERIAELSSRATSEQNAQCLLFKGLIRKDQGLHENARSEWMEAIPKSQPDSFLRSRLEFEMGLSYETENLVEDARNYYRSAIETCAMGAGFSGNAQLGSYLAINNGEISPEDENIVNTALAKSWRVLELPGEPDSTDLATSIRKLCEGFADKVRRITES